MPEAVEPLDEPSLWARFEAVVSSQPNAEALRVERSVVTFGELRDAALRLASRLVSLPAVAAWSPPSPRLVAVALPLSATYVATLLGIVSAGYGFVPLSLSWPHERLRAVLADCSPLALISADATHSSLAGCAFLHEPALRLFSRGATPRVTVQLPSRVAYVCYTSGSTGVPRGVLGTSSWLAARCAWQRVAFPFAPSDVAALRTQPCFVDAVAEAFCPLLAGCPLALQPQANTSVPPSSPALGAPLLADDPLAFVSFLAAARVTRLTLVPSHAAALLPPLSAAGGIALRFLFLSGEALPVPLAARLASALPSTRLVNLYGSTETGADCTCYDLSADDSWHRSSGAVPIGRPLPGVVALVLDPSTGLPVTEAGQVGELFIAGESLADGYLGEAEPDEAAPERATGEEAAGDSGGGGGWCRHTPRFVRLNAAEEPGDVQPLRAHATGDLVSRSPRGELLFHGRVTPPGATSVSSRNGAGGSHSHSTAGPLLSSLLKVRGARVSLLEVEAALLAHEWVASAAAAAWPSEVVRGGGACEGAGDAAAGDAVVDPESSIVGYVVLRAPAAPAGGGNGGGGGGRSGDARPPPPPTPAALRAWAAARLPPAAAPARVVVLHSMPLLKNSYKLDRASLPPPPPLLMEPQTGGEAPLVRALCDAFAAALPHRAASALPPSASSLSPSFHSSSDFFESGGTSLSGISLCGALSVPLSLLFAHPTPSSLAASGGVSLAAARAAVRALRRASPDAAPAAAACGAAAAVEEEDAPAAAVGSKRPRPVDDGDAPLAHEPPPRATHGPAAPPAAPAACAVSFAGRTFQLDGFGGGRGGGSGGGSRGGEASIPLPPLLTTAPPPPPPPSAAAPPFSPLRLAPSWRVHCGACVDAPPLLLLLPPCSHDGPADAPAPACACGAADGTAAGECRAVFAGHAGELVCVSFHLPPPSPPQTRPAPPARVLWRAQMPRHARGSFVDGGAAPLQCGAMAVVALERGDLALLRLSDGALRSVLRLGGDEAGDGVSAHALKAAPVLDTSSGCLWVASHGAEVFRIEHRAASGEDALEVTWRGRVSGKVSAPVSCHPEGRAVFVATLTGGVHCFTVAPPSAAAGVGSAAVRAGWSVPTGGAPVFGAPALVVSPRTRDVLIVSCADGALRGFDAATGDAAWIARVCPAGQPLFCAPCQVPPPFNGGVDAAPCVVVGTESGAVVCVRAADGATLWTLPPGCDDGGDDRRLVASIGADADPPDWWARRFPGTSLLVAAHAGGRVRIIAAPSSVSDGSGALPIVVASCRLPGGVFSPPVARRGAMLLGCRDDHGYALVIEEG